jgi:uncharacterized protein (TIGR01777 family)
MENATKMKVLISGSTGLIGSALVDLLKRNGHEPVRLVRRKGQFDEPQIAWNIEKGQLNPQDLEGIDAVVHLAGESIASHRWSEPVKQQIRNSRVKGTRLLAETLASMAHPPKTLVCASAIGYYGDQGSETLNEVSSMGKGFLPAVCREWEAACQPARDKGIRVANTRFGIVLSPKGGALKAMYWPFQLGLAGNLGNGKQYMSWVALDDVAGAIEHVLTHPQIRGPVNVTAPHPVTNAQFTSTMRQVLIPAFLPMHYWTPPAPALAIQALLGEMGNALLLASTRVKPVVLQETGYQFKFTELEPALRSMI